MVFLMAPEESMKPTAEARVVRPTVRGLQEASQVGKVPVLARASAGAAAEARAIPEKKRRGLGTMKTGR